MAYRSPYRILYFFGEDETETDLLRLRKKMLAELDLSGQVTLQGPDEAYTKDEIIKAFDELRDGADREAHRVIFENKALLAFLEDREGEHDTAAIAAFYQALTDERVKHFIGNELIKPLGHNFPNALSKYRFSACAGLLPLVELASDEVKGRCYDAVFETLKDLQDFFSGVVSKLSFGKAEIKPDERFEAVYKYGIAKLLNALPLPFDEPKQKLIKEIYNCLLYCNHRKVDVFDKALYSRELRQVKCSDPEVKEGIIVLYELLSTPRQEMTVAMWLKLIIGGLWPVAVLVGLAYLYKPAFYIGLGLVAVYIVITIKRIRAAEKETSRRRREED
jgi:hypothetical protein